jgi:hypothetical protein
MSPLSRELNESPVIKSVTLADLEFGRPSPFDRVAGMARMAIILFGAVSFGAAAGAVGFYFAGASDVPERAAAAVPDAAPDAELADTAPATTGSIDTSRAGATDAPIIAARLPRPRPDEPAETGSIGATAAAHGRVYGPCAALADLGAAFAFRVRCTRETRAYAPPPGPYYYYPQPYSPPRYVR